jgi:hypothetical protein
MDFTAKVSGKALLGPGYGGLGIMGLARTSMLCIGFVISGIIQSRSDEGVVAVSAPISEQQKEELRILVQAALPGLLQQRADVERRYGEAVSVFKCDGKNSEIFRRQYACGLVVTYEHEMVQVAWFEWSDVSRRVTKAIRGFSDKWTTNDFTNAVRHLRQVLVDPSGIQAVKAARRDAAITAFEKSTRKDWLPIDLSIDLTDRLKRTLDATHQKRAKSVGDWYAVNLMGLDSSAVDEMSVACTVQREGTNSVILLQYYDPNTIKRNDNGSVPMQLGGFPEYFEIFLNGKDGSLYRFYASPE